MKLLIDNCLSPTVAKKLNEIGFTAVHVFELGLGEATDLELFNRAEKEDEIIVTADTDFGTILFTRGKAKPSIIMFKKDAVKKPGLQFDLLSKNLNVLSEELAAGVVIVLTEDRIRVRSTVI